jgi:hypothetical protein
MNIRKIILTLAIAYSAHTCCMQPAPKSWYQRARDYVASYFQQPAIPQDFDQLPNEIKENILNRAILSEKTLAGSIRTAQRLSNLRRFNYMINDARFTDQLINQLQTKVKSFLGPSTFDIALALGTAGARQWITNQIKEEYLIRNAAEAFVTKALKNREIADQRIEQQVEFLIQAGAAPKNERIVIRAAEARRPTIVKLLLERGADPNEVVLPAIECPTDLLYESPPQSALDIATENGDQEIIRLLKRYRAKTGPQIMESHFCTIL